MRYCPPPVRVSRGGLDEPIINSPNSSRVTARRNPNIRPPVSSNRRPHQRYLTREEENRRPLLPNLSPPTGPLPAPFLFPPHGKGGRRLRTLFLTSSMNQPLFSPPSTPPKAYPPEVAIGILHRIAVVPARPHPLHLLLSTLPQGLGRSFFESRDLRAYLTGSSESRWSPFYLRSSVSMVKQMSRFPSWRRTPKRLQS